MRIPPESSGADSGRLGRRQVRDQPSTSRLCLELRWEQAGIEWDPVYLDEPGERVAPEQVAPAELKIERAEADEIADTSRLVRHRRLRNAGEGRQLVTGQMDRLRTVEQEVGAAHRVEDACSPDPRRAPDERCRSLPRKLADQLPAEVCILGVEGLGAEPFGERLDLIDELPERLRDASVIHYDVTLTGRPDELRLVNAAR